MKDERTMALFWEHLTQQDRQYIIELLEHHRYKWPVHMGTLMFVPVNDVLQVLHQPWSPDLERAKKDRTFVALHASIHAVLEQRHGRLLSILTPKPVLLGGPYE